MNDEIMKLAKECKAVDIDHKPMRHIFTSDQLETFYRAAFNAGLEAAAKVCDEMQEDDPSGFIATTIRALEMK